jgi:L-ascorbate metabolism protein UlaG (beta-lactamase superfamily)
MHRQSTIWTVLLLVSLALVREGRSDTGKPVAVRWWGQAMVSIETYWNLRIVIDPYSNRVGYKDPRLNGDLVLITHEHADHNNADAVRGEPFVVRGLSGEGSVQPIFHVLDRLPNQDGPTWRSARLKVARTGHAVVVSSIPAWHDNDQGAKRGATAMFAIEVDGVRIVHCGDLGQSRLTDEQLQAMGRVDVLLIPVGGVYTIDGPQAAAIVEQVHPRFAVPIHYKTPALAFDLQPVEPFVTATESNCEVIREKGNTLAVAAERPNDIPTKSKVVVLQYEPWKPTGELADLFARMDAASRNAEAVFAPLSVEQTNFRPSNGTHTPRWNAEHMAGRELLFFTQIYAGKEPTFKPIDLNPAQMPEDYKAAHPDWSGAEEARRIERTREFVRRFAYLLDGIGLDERISGSRWNLRRLLGQMEAHYGEHTANVKKKFDLPDWPQQ